MDRPAHGRLRRRQNDPTGDTAIQPIVFYLIGIAGLGLGIFGYYFLTKSPQGPKPSVAWLVQADGDPSDLVIALAPHGKVYVATPTQHSLNPDASGAVAAVLRTDEADASRKLAALATEDSNAPWHVLLRSAKTPTEADIDRFLKTLGGLSYTTTSIGVEPGLKGVFKNPPENESRADRSTGV